MLGRGPGREAPSLRSSEMSRLDCIIMRAAVKSGKPRTGIVSEDHSRGRLNS